MSAAIAYSDEDLQRAWARHHADQLDAWRDDPARFARDAFGVRLWSKQVEIALAVVLEKRVAVRSGHKIGKTRLLAVLALWWVVCGHGERVVMTSMTNQQVKLAFWREVRKLYLLARKKGTISLPRPAKVPALGMNWKDGRQIVAFTTSEEESLAGISGRNMLFLVDEASGVPAWVFEVIKGNLAGGGKLVATGNPTQTSGDFFDAFHSKADLWFTFWVSSWETPNCTGLEPRIEGLAEKSFVEESARDWGRDSAAFKVRVEGNFPPEGADVVVPLVYVLDAQERWQRLVEEAERLELGVDVARFGDDESVIAPLRGKKVWPVTAVHGYDSTQVAGKVMEAVRAHRRPGEPRALIKIDCTGGYGGGVADQLRQFEDEEIEIVEVTVSEKTSSGNCVTVRDVLWWGARMWLKEGGGLPPDAKLLAELTAPTYRFDDRARIKVESKDDFRKRLGRSPDRADAVCLAIYSAPSSALVPDDDVYAGDDSRWQGMPGRGYG